MENRSRGCGLHQVTTTQDPAGNDSNSATSNLLWGIWLISVGAFFVMGSQWIPKAVLTGNSDPGPAFIPVSMGGLLLCGGVVSLVRSTMLRRGVVEVGMPKPGGDNKAVIHFAICTGVYVVLVPLGFYSATVLFVFVVVKNFGAASWMAIVASAFITTFVWVLFVRGFLVPLPTLLETFSRFSS